LKERDRDTGKWVWIRREEAQEVDQKRKEGKMKKIRD
jgi:hypothetical protein